MAFLAIALLGLISFFRLPIDLLPDVSYPRLVVYTSYPDVAPAEVERLVTEPVESQSAAVAGVEEISSSSREGVSLVTLRFAWGTDMDFAMLNLRERLDNVRETLPRTATRPRILRVDPESEPIMVVSVAGGEDLWRTKEIAETVFRRRLEQLDGVAEAAVTGGLDREIQVEVDPELLEAYGVAIEDVGRALAAANVTAPGGTILQGRYRYPVRTLGEFETVPEMADVVVARQPVYANAGDTESIDTRLVRLRDVGRVIDGFKERESVAKYAGTEAVGLLVFKESGANTVRVAELVEETLDLLRQEYDDFQLDVASSQAGFIADSISNVVSALVFGGLLAFFVLFFFLRDPRYPIGVALAIPLSVIATFGLMEAFDVSLNIMSLGGLALGVGMLVDNSIVVLENIFRHRELGAGPLESAARGAEEVQGAITASTLTTVSVFGPIIYVEGVAGELFGDLSLAVTFSLLASLLVALTLLPTFAARFSGGFVGDALPEEEQEEQRRGRLGRMTHSASQLGVRGVVGVGRFFRDLVVFWIAGIASLVRPIFRPAFAVFDRVFDAFAVRYHSALEWSLDHRGTVMAGSAAALALTAGLLAVLPRDLLPDVDQGAFDVRLALEEGTSLETTLGAAARIEEGLLADEDVEVVFSRIGRDVRSYAESEDASGLHTATFQVRLAEGAATEAVLERMRPMTEEFPVGALTFKTGQATALGRMLGGVDADIAVRIRAEDLDLAFAQALEVERRLGELDGIGNIRIARERGVPQVQVEIRRDQAARYGIDPQLVAETLERANRGDRATEYVDFDRKIDVVVRLPDELRYSRESLDHLRVQGVPIRELINVREALAPSEIEREDQGRVTVVHADVVTGGLGAAVGRVQEALSTLPRERGMRVEVGGENEEMRRSFRDLAFAFGLALLLVYMILAAQFESFVQPLTILTAVPLALVGAVLGLAVAGQGMNTMSLIGTVILIGIVVNDAIVKVDFINQARARGAELRAAILEAGQVRLRPIVMTTVTTVLGLTPMALGIGSGADLRAPLAIAVIGGLLVATVLTLIVVPVVYSLLVGPSAASASDPTS